MADRARLTDVQLEGALRAIGQRYPYPPTPNVAASVRARIVARPTIVPARRPMWREPLRLALVAAAALVLIAAAALINPASRDAIAHFFHIRGVVITRVPSPLPSASPITSLSLGEPTTLERAQSAVGFHLAVPPQLGTPDAVYLDSTIPGGEVALAYKPRADLPLVRTTGLGALITEFRGDLSPEGIFTKEVGPGTTVEEVTVNGDAAWWIEGEPHIVMLANRIETLRLASNTLIWEHGGVTYRIESGLTKAGAMRIAQGMP